MGEVVYLSPTQKWQNRHVQRANIPRRFLGLSPDTVRPATLRTVVDGFIRKASTGPDTMTGLMLYGHPGRGKTRTAALLLEQILRSAPQDWLGYEFGGVLPETPGYFVGYAELIEITKDSFDSSDHDGLLRGLHCRFAKPSQNTRVLVLDDIGKEHSGASGFTVNTLHNLLRSRFDKGALTIVTTNIPPNQWGDVYGEAMGSFIKEAFVKVEVTGADHR